MRTLGSPSRQIRRLRDVLLTTEKEIELLALSKVRWPGHETVQIKGRFILYSGPSRSITERGRSGAE